MRFVAFLRAIANVPMAPYRKQLEAMGYTEVESFGASGNLLFTGKGLAREHEWRISTTLGARAFVRGRPQLERIAKRDPYADRKDAIVTFLDRAPSAASCRALNELDVKGEPPVLLGRELYHVHPLLVGSRKTPLDVEKLLGVQGTFRTSRVVQKLAQKLRE